MFIVISKPVVYIAEAGWCRATPSHPWSSAHLFRCKFTCGMAKHVVLPAPRCFINHFDLPGSILFNHQSTCRVGSNIYKMQFKKDIKHIQVSYTGWSIFIIFIMVCYYNPLHNMGRISSPKNTLSTTRGRGPLFICSRPGVQFLHHGSPRRSGRTNF